jgi:predicted porin
VSYQERRDLVPGSATLTAAYKEGGAGFNYEVKPFAVNAGYFFTNPLDGAVDSIVKTRAFWAGAAYNFTPVSVVYAQVGKTSYDFVGPRGSGDGITYGVAYNYFLSKRTNLYAAYGGVNNDNARLRLSTGSQTLGGAVFGASPKAFVTGVRHSF